MRLREQVFDVLPPAVKYMGYPQTLLAELERVLVNIRKRPCFSRVGSRRPHELIHRRRATVCGAAGAENEHGGSDRV